MIRLIYITIGSVTGGLLMYLFTRVIGYFIEPYYSPSGEDDMTRNFVIFIAIFFVFVFIGGFVANSLFNKSLAKR